MPICFHHADGITRTSTSIFFAHSRTRALNSSLLCHFFIRDAPSSSSSTNDQRLFNFIRFVNLRIKGKSHFLPDFAQLFFACRPVGMFYKSSFNLPADFFGFGNTRFRQRRIHKIGQAVESLFRLFFFRRSLASISFRSFSTASAVASCRSSYFPAPPWRVPPSLSSRDHRFLPWQSFQFDLIRLIDLGI